MAELALFSPLFQEKAEDIRERMNTDLNAGMALDDPDWIDTREGSFYFDVTEPSVLEFARLWEALSLEVPAASFVQYAWGEYLDFHAEVFGLERKDEAAASGTVLLTGDAGVLVPEGTIVSTAALNEDGDVVEFETTQAGTTGPQLAAPTSLTATPAGTGGTLPAGTYYYKATAYNTYGETIGTVETPATVSGSTSAVLLDWPDVAGATGYRAYRAAAAGGTGVRIYQGATSVVTDTNLSGTITGPPTVNSTAGVRLTVQATEPGTLGNVSAGAIEDPGTLEGINAVRNEAATSAGSEEESDEGLKTRVLLEYNAAGGANENFYKRLALAHQGIGRAQVEAVAYGPGTVRVVVMEDDGDPVAASLVAEVQAELDPIAGQGKGLAPAGVQVFVETPAVLLIDVVGVVTFKTGYNLDGGGGLIAQRARIETALGSYIEALEVGEDVVYEHVKAMFFTVNGVQSISGVTVEGGTVDVVVPAGSVPQLGTVGLS